MKISGFTTSQMKRKAWWRPKKGKSGRSVGSKPKVFSGVLVGVLSGGLVFLAFNQRDTFSADENLLPTIWTILKAGTGTFTMACLGSGCWIVPKATWSLETAKC